MIGASGEPVIEISDCAINGVKPPKIATPAENDSDSHVPPLSHPRQNLTAEEFEL